MRAHWSPKGRSPLETISMGMVLSDLHEPLLSEIFHGSMANYDTLTYMDK
jgi:hypothetical protein